jgi:hypothetical protein
MFVVPAELPGSSRGACLLLGNNHDGKMDNGCKDDQVGLVQVDSRQLLLLAGIDAS